jgi:hypothetical protein
VRQLVGRFADAVQAALCESLAERRPRFDWTTERRVGATPVDVAGEAADHLVAVELEWRRADPADNTAKLFRHLESGTLDEFDRVTVAQVFTWYYDLTSGGIDSKRKNAEFVGSVAERTLDGVAYHAVEFDLDPPKRGGDRPEGWGQVVDETAVRVSSLV